MAIRPKDARFRACLLTALLLVMLSWVGDRIRLYEHPYLGFINPGPSFLLALLLSVGLLRGWRLARGVAMLYLSIACLGYLLVSFQRHALEVRALGLAVGGAFVLYLLTLIGQRRELSTEPRPFS
jgi:hypothetical protein